MRNVYTGKWLNRFALSILLLTLSEATMALELPAHYAESVMIHSLSEDGGEDVSLRLARFPDKGVAHVWLHVANEKGAWSLVDESFELTHVDATAVRDDAVEFSAGRGTQWLRFESAGRNSGRLEGRVTGELLVASTRHPREERGTVALAIDIDFAARSAGYRSPTNRWEITGRLAGTLDMAGNAFEFDHHYGKWHEQTGPRARFAPAFTYLNVQNEQLALLAIGYADGAAGYAQFGQQTVGVSALTIDPPGSEERKFSVLLEDGRKIEGRSRMVQHWSVPIEGQRRPGSSVIVDSNYATLWGTLNDWDPEA